MKKKLNGTFTIEAAVIVPVILVVFSLLVTMLFYYHDKNIVTAISHETVVMGCRKEEITENELEEYFQMRVQKKLLLFGRVDVTARIDKDTIRIACRAKKGSMSLQAEMSMQQTEPEDYIRNLRRIEKLKEGIGKQ